MVSKHSGLHIACAQKGIVRLPTVSCYQPMLWTGTQPESHSIFYDRGDRGQSGSKSLLRTRTVPLPDVER